MGPQSLIGRERRIRLVFGSDADAFIRGLSFLFLPIAASADDVCNSVLQFWHFRKLGRVGLRVGLNYSTTLARSMHDTMYALGKPCLLCPRSIGLR